ncbi:hypothetical protein B0H14DRAFT_3132846 [Mycena olivaceomarginata]|nr:hypothetical protein B0H14DRAFT_3132846 [Mycena olivaceomarginata]
MFTKFIPLAVLVGAAVSSNATPVDGRGHTVTVTQILPAVTIFQCPTASSSSSSSSSSSIAISASVSVSASVAVTPLPIPSNIITPDLTELLARLESLGGLVDTVTGLIPYIQSLLNAVLKTLTDTVSNLVGGLGGLFGQSGPSPSPATTQAILENKVKDLITNIAAVTNEIWGLNNVLTRIGSGPIPATCATDISTRAQAILRKLSALITAINQLSPDIIRCKPANLDALKTALTNLLSGITTLFPRLTQLCTGANAQAITAAYNKLFGESPRAFTLVN